MSTTDDLIRDLRAAIANHVGPEDPQETELDMLRVYAFSLINELYRTRPDAPDDTYTLVWEYRGDGGETVIENYGVFPDQVTAERYAGIVSLGIRASLSQAFRGMPVLLSPMTCWDVRAMRFFEPQI